MSQQGQIRIGMAGWRYDEWRGTFYPEDLTQKRELEYASRQLNSLELNGTFYSTQRPKSFQSWHKETPDDFVFAIKGSQFITHIRKLENVETALANFLAQGMLSLGAKFGPILWQLPPHFSIDLKRLEISSSSCREHTSRRQPTRGSETNGWRAAHGWKSKRTFRFIMRLRSATRASPSPNTFPLLRENNIALVVADTVKWPCMMDTTADIVYCRLHGNEKLYPNGYTADAIDLWARRVIAWSRGEEVSDGTRIHPDPGPKRDSRDVFVYFDDDNKVRAPFDAMSLSERIKEINGE